MLARINKSYVPAYWDDFFNDSFFNSFNVGRRSCETPAVNVTEENEEFRIEFAVPGFAKEDIKIDLESDILTISSEQKESKEEKNRQFVRREFGHSTFKRSFQLPDTIDIDGIKANHSDGILLISLPKKEEVITNAQRSIEIA